MGIKQLCNDNLRKFRNEMSFGIGQGFAEVQILKNSKTALSLWIFLKYFDKIMHKHSYWRELDRGIAKCNLSSEAAIPRSKFKSKWIWTIGAS